MLPPGAIFKPKIINHMRLRPGLCPGAHCRSLHSSPRPSSWFLGGGFAAGEGEERGIKGKAGEEKGGERSATSFLQFNHYH